MRATRKILAALFLVAGALVALYASLRLAGVDTARADALLETDAGRIAAWACLGITALGVLACSLSALLERPEPAAVHPQGDPGIEVTLSAVVSCARAAAADADALVEQVEGRICGRDRDEVRLTVEAISLVGEGLDEIASRMRQRVEDACSRMLGIPGVHVRVRFLPSKTVTVTKEV